MSPQRVNAVTAAAAPMRSGRLSKQDVAYYQPSIDKYVRELAHEVLYGAFVVRETSKGMDKHLLRLRRAFPQQFGRIAELGKISAELADVTAKVDQPPLNLSKLVDLCEGLDRLCSATERHLANMTGPLVDEALAYIRFGPHNAMDTLDCGIGNINHLFGPVMHPDSAYEPRVERIGEKSSPCMSEAQRDAVLKTTAKKIGLGWPNGLVAQTYAAVQGHIGNLGIHKDNSYKETCRHLMALLDAAVIAPPTAATFAQIHVTLRMLQQPHRLSRRDTFDAAAKEAFDYHIGSLVTQLDECVSAIHGQIPSTQPSEPPSLYGH